MIVGAVGLIAGLLWRGDDAPNDLAAPLSARRLLRLRAVGAAVPVSAIWGIFSMFAEPGFETVGEG
jgi:hypothetical protein